MPLEKDAETIRSNSTSTIVEEKQTVEECVPSLGDVEKGGSINLRISGEKQTTEGLPNEPHPPIALPLVTFPDGGFIAWSQVAMGFLIMFSTW